MEDKGFYSFEGDKFQFIGLQESEISCEFKNENAAEIWIPSLSNDVLSYVELYEENGHWGRNIANAIF